MLRKRLLILLGGCFLMGSAAWADDVGYVDCTSHPDDAKVFAKARQTPDVVASVSCGERFTILVYGFIFSRVQTKDGKVGYVYSSLISVDHTATSVQQSASVRVAPPPAAAQAPQPGPVSVSQPQPAPTQAAPAQVAVRAASATSAPVFPTPPPQPTSSAPEATPAVAHPSPAPSAQPEPAPSLPTAAQVEAATSASATQPASSASETAAPPAPSDPVTYSAPQPASAEPASAAVRNASTRSTWERPVPGAGNRRTFLLELFGGFSYAGINSNGTMTNFLGGMGSVGYNMTTWLQIVGDSSYNTVTVSGTKNVIYGNHFGPRFYYRRFNRWSITPFAEALIGGSRLDASYSGTKTSTNCISYKAGGGIDILIKRHWEVRLLDVDYYRTSFGTNLTQNYYAASAGVVLRLFGSSSAE